MTKPRFHKKLRPQGMEMPPGKTPSTGFGHAVRDAINQNGEEETLRRYESARQRGAITRRNKNITLPRLP